MTGSNIMPIVHTEDFDMVLEYNREVAVLHCPRVDRMNKTVFLTMNIAVESVSDFCEFHGYAKLCAAVPEGDKVGRKLAESFGFEYIGTEDGYDVFEYGDLF